MGLPTDMKLPLIVVLLSLACVGVTLLPATAMAQDGDANPSQNSETFEVASVDDADDADNAASASVADGADVADVADDAADAEKTADPESAQGDQTGGSDIDEPSSPETDGPNGTPDPSDNLVEREAEANDQLVESGLSEDAELAPSAVSPQVHEDATPSDQPSPGVANQAATSVQPAIQADAASASPSKQAAKAETNVEQNTVAATSAASMKAATATASATASTASANAQVAAKIADGVYVIATALKSSKCLDVPNASASSKRQMQVYAQNCTAAQRWKVKSVGDGLYTIVSVATGKALAVAKAKAANGVAVKQQKPSSTTAQKWKFVSIGSGRYKLVSALSDSYVLDLVGDRAADGAKVRIWSDTGAKDQAWRLMQTKTVATGFYTLKNSGSGKMATVKNGSVKNKGNIWQYAANGSLSQTFKVSYSASNGYYKLLNVGSGKALAVARGSSKSGANAWQYASKGSNAQRWAAVKNADGTITFRSAISGLALDVANGSKANKANVQLWKSNGTKAQKWSLSKVSNWLPEGAYTIYTAVNAGNVVDIDNGSVTNGANVQVYALNGTNAQRFYLRSAGNGALSLQNPVSGKYLNATAKSSGANVALGTERLQFEPVFAAGGVRFVLKSNAKLALDVAGGSKASGANVGLHVANGTKAQKFLLKETDLFESGTYSIRYAANADYVIDDPNASKKDGVQMQLYESNGTSAQRFALKRVAANTYRIVSAESGRSLQAVKTDGGSYEVQQRSATKASDQKWNVTLAADGSVQIAPNSNPGMRIDLSSGKVRNGTPIIVYAANNTKAQNWKLVSEGDSTTYDKLGLTLRRMAELQKDNSYNANLTVQDLVDLLDPSLLNKTQFLDLRATTSVTAAQLNAFISSTSSGKSGLLKGLGSSFVSAAKQYNLNEVYLLAHAILESGWGTSTLAKGYYYEGGTIDGTRYAAGTYYNFYGIGAYDSSPLSGGRKLAIINGWNTPEKAVTGAAKWISKNYVHASSYAQPTLYAMKWDYARSDATGEYGWHQYATSTSWPNSIAQLIDECYSSIGGNANPVYLIVKYKS